MSFIDVDDNYTMHLMGVQSFNHSGIMEFLKEFQEEPEGVNEIAVHEPSAIGDSDPYERVRDPDFNDLESFVNMPVYLGDSYLMEKMPIVRDETFAFRFPDLLSTIKQMMNVAQRKHFNASVDKTLTNWFRKLFIAMNTLFGSDALISRDSIIGDGISVREFCFRCFYTILHVQQGGVERSGESIPSEPELLIWYMAPVKAWLSLIIEKVVHFEVYIQLIMN